MFAVGVLRKDAMHRDITNGNTELSASLNVVSMRVKAASAGPSPELFASGYPSTPVGSLEDQDGDSASYQGVDPEDYITK